jgi:ATP-binding cassette subfamily F protein uup
VNLLSAENISKSFSEKLLFNNISFGVAQGDKIALVGANGTGKSTFLKVLAGVLQPDTGSVSIRKGVRVGYLLQQHDMPEDLTIWDAIFYGDSKKANLVRNYEEAINNPDTSPEKLQDLMTEMENLQAWDFEAKIQEVLGKLDIHHYDQRIAELSGGQRKRVALAKVLLEEPDLLLFDEPTNHLDVAAIEWLESYLSSSNTTLIMVTHDRYFLDSVANEIIEIDRGNLYRHKGNYAHFLEQKAERYTIQQATIDKARNLMVRELEWMRRQPKARGTKSQARIDAFYELKEQASQKIEQNKLEIHVKAQRQGKKIIEAHHLSKSIEGKKLLDNFSYTFKKGERIGIIGRNGVGKSTFLNVLSGKLAADSGEIEKGETIKVGYYTQETENLNPALRVIDEAKSIAEYITLGNGETVTVSKLLEQFLFPPSQQYSYISKLSGGERRRLQLLKVLIENPNFLILDEPTNDLDMDTLNVLEDFLLQYEGCLLLVSHDRYFMDKLTEHLFIFEGEGKIKDFPGNYSDYRQEQEQKAKAPKVAAEPVKPKPTELTPNPAKVVKKLSFKEQKELETLEAELEQLEKQKTDLTNALQDSNKSHEELTQMAQKIIELDANIEQKTMRWLELSE